MELLHLEDVQQEGADRNEVAGRIRQVVQHAHALEAEGEVAGGGDQPGSGCDELGQGVDQGAEVVLQTQQKQLVIQSIFQRLFYYSSL